MILPPEARPLVAALVFSFTGQTYQRFSALLVGAVLTTGRRTVAKLLRTLHHLTPIISACSPAPRGRGWRSAAP
ncbi:unnamed protein product [Gemmata massiliana]|uniref:Uncharacterized protein n=1 Tax=Gemmata massiliana TaxID=1210884 RepID=A0A6P2DD20_9BACT|nr:hypothetical protein [Gemmata massiliana]VTR99201.1 unnamed protein product [Gemmata massiliana]